MQTGVCRNSLHATRNTAALRETGKHQSALNLFAVDVINTELDCPVDWGNVLSLQDFYFDDEPQDFPHVLHCRVRDADDVPGSWKPGQLKKINGDAAHFKRSRLSFSLILNTHERHRISFLET